MEGRKAGIQGLKAGSGNPGIEGRKAEIQGFKALAAIQP
jgi:hypothetical protein